MKKIFSLWLSATTSQNMVTRSKVEKWQGVLRFAIFLSLALVIAFSVQMVHADDDLPAPEGGDDVVATISDESEPDTDGTDPIIPNPLTDSADEGVSDTAETDLLVADSLADSTDEGTSSAGETAPLATDPLVDSTDEDVSDAGPTDLLIVDPLMNPTDECVSNTCTIDSLAVYPLTDPAAEGEFGTGGSEPVVTDPATAPIDDLLREDNASGKTITDELPSPPDPQFCSSGDPASGTCDENRTLIVTDPNTGTPGALDDVDSDGTIYLAKGQTFNEEITISEMAHDLVFSGGWDFDLGTFTPGDTSTLNGPISITDSLGTIRFENIIFGLGAPIVVDNSSVEIMGTDGNDVIQITLTGANNGTVAVDGKDGSDSYTVNLSGGAGSKTVNVDDSGTIGTDSLAINATDMADVILVSTDSVSLGTETVVFNGIEMTSLDGKDGSDSYTVNLSGGAGSKTVNVDDSGTIGADSLAINATDMADVILINTDSVSLGTETVLFSGIEMTSLDGRDGMDELVGPDADTEWQITDDDAGKVVGIDFSSIENLTGGSAEDTFKFANGKGISGAIDGGGGVNTLDYSAYTSAVIVNLNSEVVTAGGAARDPNSATGVGGGIANILNVMGGSGNDILIGTGYGGALSGGGGTDIIIVSDPRLMVGALKTFLQEFQHGLFSNVFGNAIPLIGDALSKECDAENDLCPGAFITEYVFTALEKFDNSLVTDMDSFLDQLDRAFGTLGLVSASFALTPSNLIEGSLYKEDDIFEVPFGTGLDGLQLAIGEPGEDPPAVIRLDLDWFFALAFGMDETHGFFVNPNGTQLTVDVDASFLDQDPHLGTLGLFQAKIVDGVGENRSHFMGTYTVTLPGMDNIYGSDLLDLPVLPVQGRLTSTVSQIYLTIEKAAFLLGDDLELPEDIPDLFNMAIKADLSIVWNFNNADTGMAHESFGEEPSVRFNNIYLDPGPFFNQILQPFIKGIQKITLPLQPIIDILLAPIPVLSEFGLLPGTVLELLGANQGIVAAVTLINAINKITFGSGVDCAGGSDSCVWIAIGDGFEVTDPRVEDAKIPVPEPIFGDWQPTWKLESEKYGFSMGGDLFGEDEFDFFDFPILEDPNEVYGMILGIHARLFTVNLPEISLTYELPDDLKACLWQTLCVKFYGEIGITAGPMEFGYDTKGIGDFIGTGSANVALLADGFYVADLCRVDGSLETCQFPYGDDVEVERVPLVELHFDVGAALSVGIDLKIFSVEAGVKGGVEGSIRFNLHDGRIGLPDDSDIDGRIRGSEIGWNAAIGWTCIFDISGEIEAYLSLYVEVSTDLGLFSITWYENSWDIARITLVEFCQSCEGTPPPLAHLDGNELILHTGDQAGTLTNLPSYSQNEYFVVSHTGGTSEAESLTVSAYGYEQQFEGVQTIRADGGEGNDKITINSGVLSDAVLIGGNGDDTLIYKGSGTAWLYGEAGNDLLKGGSGRNYLYGGKLPDSDEDADEDTSNRIWIEPDPEKNIGIYDEVNDEWIGYYERQFNDQLFGGPGENWLYAGKGDDKLFGGAGVNHMFGDDGDDVLSAGEGENYMSGGLGDDSFIWTTGGGISTVSGGDGDGNSLFLNLKSNTSQLTVGAEGSTGQVWINDEPLQIMSFDDIQELTINPSVGVGVTINDVFSTALRSIYVNTKVGVSIGSPVDAVTIYGRALNDNILVDTQPLDNAGNIQAAHVGFCADTPEFCPTDPDGKTDFLLELFVTGSSVNEDDLLIVDGGDGNDVFQVRPGPQKKVFELINLELRGGADSDTVLGLNVPNVWTMTDTNSGDLNAEFSFSGMEKLIGGTDFDTLIGPNFASTFRMVSDFDGVLNDSLYYFSMQKLVGASNSDTLVGSDTYNFWSLLALNEGELYRFAGPDGLMALLEELRAAGLFANNGIYNSLRNRLELALNATEMGRLERAAMEVWMFVWKLDDAALHGQLSLPGGSTVTACSLSSACRVGGTLVYTSFENLTGGGSDDLFTFEDGMGISGVLDGADGTDWLDYSKYSTTVHVNTKQGYAVGTGGILNVERIMGRAPANVNSGGNQTAASLEAGAVFSITQTNDMSGLANLETTLPSVEVGLPAIASKEKKSGK